MFKNDFQGGTHFEVFSAQGKDPIAHWKLTGSSGIKKEFDKSVKSYVYVLDGSAATTKMQLPKDPRHNLALVQRYLVIQLLVPKGADFSIDLGIQDLNGSKRRLHFSTAIRETSTTPLHSKVPLSLINRDLWCNLCIDLSNFVLETWPGQTYKSIDNVCLSANCKLRRVFTMRTQPPDTTNDEEVYGPTGTHVGEMEGIPRQCQLAPDILQATQVLNFLKILHFEGKRRPPPEIILDTSSSGSVLDTSSSCSSRYHIAFGTKMPGTAQKKSASREGVNTSRSSKPNSTRIKSDSSIDLPQNRQSSAPTLGYSKHLRSVLTRDRKNSDPGSNQEDPEMSVDKESLRTSHTWTDGADHGKDSIPFVKPHPPREPSADRIHRKPRVKSAGKERSAQHIAVSNREDQSSSHYTSTSEEKSFGASDRPYQPTVIANVEELTRIMSNMQESTQRGMYKSESESEPNSHNTSGGPDDSLDEVINTLRTTDLTAAREYEDTDNDDDDEEEEEDEKEQVFLFSSKPKTAPRHKKTRKLGQRLVKPRVMPCPELTLQKERTTIDESDFVRAGSSEDEESIMTRVLRHHPSPRVSPVTSANKARLSTHAVSLPTEPLPAPSSNQPALAKAAQVKLNGHDTGSLSTGRGLVTPVEYPGVRSSLRSPHGQIYVDRSPLGSQSRMSIRKKSLREIPKDDVRLSQQSKPYSPDKYVMDELSESYEAAMLQSLQRQTLEEGVVESEDDGRQPHRHSHLHYSDHSLEESDSDSDTDRSTLKTRHAAKHKEHNYQDEMKSDFLNQSNPRDWGNVFSPPIVFPSQKSSAMLAPTTLQVPTQNDTYGGRSQPAGAREQGETDEEDELDLLYDPVLNCYFDPKTCKYYELV